MVSGTPRSMEKIVNNPKIRMEYLLKEKVKDGISP
jgi:hypothetical protein